MKLVRVFVMIVVSFSVVQSQTTPKTTTQSTKKPSSTVSTIPPTTIFKMCGGVTSTTAPSGIIQPSPNMTKGNLTDCSFTVSAPSDRHLQFSCSVLNFTDDNNLMLSGTLDAYTRPVKNRVYISWNNEIYLYSQFCFSANCWFECKWTLMPIQSPNMTNYKMCLHGSTANAVGNIQPLDGDVESPRSCDFLIVAPGDQRVQLTCSVLNFTDTLYQASLYINALDDYSQEVALNRIYYSDYNHMFLHFYRSVNADWFSCNWTMVPNVPSLATDFRLCRHAESQMANGTIQPMDREIAGPPRDCSFSIIAPIGQYLQISCSIANFTNPRNFLRLSRIAYTDSLITGLRCARPELNKVYTSVDNVLVISARIENGNWFKCNWTTTTIPPTATTSLQSGIFKLCRDLNSTAANGTIQHLNSTALSTKCNFTIEAPPDQRIQLSCSVLDSMSLTVGDVVTNVGSTSTYEDAIVNRVYTSLGNRMRLMSARAYIIEGPRWIDCNWTTIPAISDNTTKFELCRDIGTVKPSGTIQSPDWDPNYFCSYAENIRACSFFITAPPDYRVQLSCPIIKKVNHEINYLQLNGTIDYLSTAPVFTNRIYTSASNRMYLQSEVGEPHWISCNWTMILKTTTNDYKLCFDREATTASGTIQPLNRNTGNPRMCPFTITAPLNNLIVFTCSVVNLTSESSLKLEGTPEMINQTMANTTYVSALNQLNITSAIVNSDWFMCGWMAGKLQKICQDRKTNATSGIIQPVKGLVNEPRMCLFTISVSPGQRIQISCTDVTLNGLTSLLEFSEEQNNVVAHEPIVSTIYTSKNNRMFITAVVNSTDWFSCQWTTI